MAGASGRTLSWEEFLEHSVPEAKALFAAGGRGAQERYLAALAAWACRLGTVPRAARHAPLPGLPEGCRSGSLHAGEPFSAAELLLEPGADLPYRAHRGASVCTVLLEGAARIRSFELVEPPDDWTKSGPALLRSTLDELLLPGRVHLAGTRRGNVHGLRAGPAGARVVRLTTVHGPGADSGTDSGEGSFEVDEEPRDAARGIHAALWTA